MNHLRDLVEPGLNRGEPRFAAYGALDTYLDADDDLSPLLDRLREQADGDTVIWKSDGTLAAVVVHGEPRVFDEERQAPPRHHASVPTNGHSKNGTPTKRSPLPKVLGHNACSVLVWMGANDWGFTEAQAVLSRLRVNVRDNSIRGLLSGGRTGRLPTPTLSKQAVEQLHEMRQAVAVGG